MPTSNGVTTPERSTHGATSAPPSLEAAAAALELDLDLTQAAHARIQAREVCLLVVSGKIASGKDTVAPLVLERLGYANARHLYWADALKNEIDVVMDEIRVVAHVHQGQHWLLRALSARSTRASLTRHLSRTHDIPDEHAREYVELLWPELLGDSALHARARTPAIRRVLQLHGTEVRRSVDAQYWIKKGLRAAVDRLAAGESVYFTDSRFPNEVELPQALGAVAVRLDISPEVQAQRLSSRDGLAPDPASLAHASETSLDAFAGFDVRVVNEKSLDEAVTAIASALPPHEG